MTFRAFGMLPLAVLVGVTGAAPLLHTAPSSAASEAPAVVPGQRVIGVAREVGFAGGVATVAPPSLPKRPVPGDTVACAIAYSDVLRGRPAPAPAGWIGPYAPGGQDATQGRVRANDVPGQFLYYHLVREGESGGLPSFGVAMAPNADPPSMGYDCIEVRDAAPQHPIASVASIDLASESAQLPPVRMPRAAGIVEIFYAFNQAVSGVDEGQGGALASSPRLAVGAASLTVAQEQRLEHAVRVRRAGGAVFHGHALVVAFNGRSAADGGYTSELPEWSDRFADGAAAMNIRCDQSIYRGCDATIMSALRDLGIRHVSAVYPVFLGKPALLAPLRALSESGVDIIASVNPCDTDGTIEALLNIPGIRYGGVTYPNEIDLAKPAELDCRRTGLDDYGTWQNWWARRGPAVYAAFRRYGHGMPILSQSFGGKLSHYCSRGQSQTDPDCDGIGDTTQYQDIVNIHQYAGAQHPLGATGNAHEHCGKTGTLFNFACYAAFANPSGTQPRWFGERGYNDVSIPENVVAAYLPVDEMIQRISGFTRYYFFNLVDGPSGFTSTGLLTRVPEYRPKAQFYALQSLIQATSDRGAPFTPTQPLTYKLTGTTPTDFHYLLQSRNGRYTLLTASAVPVWEPQAHVPRPFTSHQITVTFPDPPQNVELLQYDMSERDPLPGRAGCTTPATSAVRFCWSPPQRLAVTRDANGSYSITYRISPAMAVLTFDER